MLKYQKNVLYKLISMLLTVAMLLTAPMGTIKAYAVGDPVCKIGDAGYYTLDDALTAVESGETITLLQDIYHNRGIEIQSKEFTFDLNKYNLNVENTNGPALMVASSKIYLSGEGSFKVTGSTYGVSANYSVVTVTNATATKGTGVHAQGDGCTVTIDGDVTGSTQGILAISNAKIIAKGDVTASAVGGNGAVQASNGAEVKISGNVEAIGDNGTGVRCENTGTIWVNGDIIANSENGCGAMFMNEATASLTVEGAITAKNYIKMGDSYKAKNDGTTDSDRPDYLKFTDTKAIVWVKKAAAPTDGTIEVEDETALISALANVTDGGTIRLGANINYTTPVVVDGKTITFNLNGFGLTIDTSAVELSTALSVKNGGVVRCSGDGYLDVKGYNCGVEADNGTVEVRHATATTGIGASAQNGGIIDATGNVSGNDRGVSAIGAGSKITVTGNVATSKNWAVGASSGSQVTVDGNVSATATSSKGVNASSPNTKVHVHGNIQAIQIGVDASNSALVTVDGDVSAVGTGIEAFGVRAQSKANIKVLGNVSANPSAELSIGAYAVSTTAGPPTEITIDGTISGENYIRLEGLYKTEAQKEAITTLPGYHTYTYTDGGKTHTVWVKDVASKACAIGAVQYATLGEALSAAKSGETITLLQNITHTNHIEVVGKIINFDLGDYDLLLDTSADSSYNNALTIKDGGKVKLTGTGTGEFNIKALHTAVGVLGMYSEAAVHNVEVTDHGDGVYMYGAGMSLESGSIITVNGNIKSEKGNGVNVNAKNGKVIVNGNITAGGRTGVQTSSNPGTQVTINGDITVTNNDDSYEVAGVLAYGQTNVTVTGNVTVQAINCIGVEAGRGTIKVGGNVASSGKGARSYSGGTVEITGSLTAGTPFIILESTEKTAAQITVPTTKKDLLTYTDGPNTVWIGSAGIPAPTYMITVQTDGNGTASANVNPAAQNAEVTLITTPNVGFRFKEWQVTSGGVNIVNNKFNMPAEHVVIKAIFESIPVTNHTVIFSLNGGTRTGGGALTQTVPNGSFAIAPTVTRSGYTFTGWDKALTNVTQSLTVTATWSYNGGGGTGGGSDSSSGDSSNIIVTLPPPDKPNIPTQTELKVGGKVETSGNLTVIITDKDITDAINKAVAKAKANGYEENGVTFVLNASTGGKIVHNLTVNLPKTVQDTIIAKKIVSTIVVVDNPHIKIGMDLSAIKEINKQANTDVNITATRMDNSALTGSAQTAIGSRPVFDFKANYGSGKAVQSFGAGSVSVTLPYTLSANEKAGNVQAVYVDASGKVQWLVSSVYDSMNKLLSFSTSHFSAYGVGYKQDATDFTDINNHWSKDDIQFVVNRGLFSGTSKTTFSPNTAMTRGMFVTALGRLANANLSAYKQSSFPDVKNDAYYMGYIEWANKNNIVTGIGDGKFAPDQSITREQMAVIMSNYDKTIGFTLPKVHAENTFADNAKVSAYAKVAVKTMQMSGVISGKNGNIFDPQGTATRAEVSAVLRRFVELVISSDDAQGWTMNGSGKWMYYENSNPVTGKKNIGGSTYTFDQYGVTVDAPKNFKYTTYTVQNGDSFWCIAHKLGCTLSELERLNNKSRFDLIHPGDVLRVPEQ